MYNPYKFVLKKIKIKKYKLITTKNKQNIL